MKWKCLIAASWLLIFGVVSAFAHNPGLSTLRLEAKGARMEITLQFAPPDQDGDGKASAAELEDGAKLLRGLSPTWLKLRSGERDVAVSDKGVTVDTAQELLIWRGSAGLSSAGEYQLRLLQLGELVSGHREFVSIIQDGATVTEALLSAREPQLEFKLREWTAPGGDPAATRKAERESPSSRTFSDFVKLGIEHILTGYDHMLYLAGLIIACRRFRSILPVITSFTIAHSLTLGLATLGIATLPSSIVEPMIAASIVYVGFENLWLRNEEPKRRWISSFIFGLIHGFGFAGLLREMGVGSDGHAVLLPLFSFNFGVELGQLSVVAVILPVWSWARRSARFSGWGVQASSAVVALVGLYWFVERVWF